MSDLLKAYNDRALMSEIALATLRSELKRKRCRRNVEESYKRMGGQLKRPKWRSSSQGLVLEDEFFRTACILFPVNARPICLWPFGRQTEYEPDFLVCTKLPALPKDLWGYIATFLGAEDLIQCRGVNRAWKEVVNRPRTWEGKFVVPTGLMVPEWSNKPLYKQYILYTLHNASMAQMVRLFLKHPPFFAHFFNCSLMNTTTHHYRLIPEAFRLAVHDRHRRFWIPMNSDTIKTDAAKFFKFSDYLEQFRQLFTGSR